MHYVLLPSINDTLEVGALEGCTTDEATVNVGLGEDFLSVAGLAAAAIENADVFCSSLAETTSDDTTDKGVHILSLLSCCGLSGADSPHGFVSEDDVCELILGEVKEAVGELTTNDFVLLAGFALLEDFANAEKRYKESLSVLPNQFLANFGLGKMLYNRAVDKIKQADLIPPEDYENGEYEKLDNESKDLMRQSIPYFINAIQFIDNLDAEGQGANRSNLYHCLTALNIVYARLEMYEELKPIKARIEELKKYAG